MGNHANTKKNTRKFHKRGYNESADMVVERRQRASFKNYLRQLEEELLDEEIDTQDDEGDEETKEM